MRVGFEGDSYGIEVCRIFLWVSRNKGDTGVVVFCAVKGIYWHLASSILIYCSIRLIMNMPKRKSFRENELNNFSSAIFTDW